MCCRKLISHTALMAGLVLAAPAAIALPTDLGRSADVYANAVRINTAASRYVDRKVFVPEVSADIVVAEDTPAPAAVPAQTDETIIYNASLALAPIKIETAPVVSASVVDQQIAEDAPEAPVAVAENANPQVVVDELDLALTTVADSAPEGPAVPIEDTVVASTAPEQSPDRLRYDEAFGVPLVAVALVNLDVPPAQFFGIDEVIPASVEWIEDLPQGAVASSRRPVAATNPERLLSVMADADDNLIIRDGGEDGPDTMMMSSDVLFSFGDATLSDEAIETLASIGKMSTDVPIIQVFGHTDAIGNEDDNLSLGQRRAEAVRLWLLENSEFTEDRVIATGVGEVDPVADNITNRGLDNPDGRAQNRRVEFAFLTVSAEVETASADLEIATAE